MPQDSNLGPLLFLIYINDLAFVSPKLFAVLFADYFNFFCTGKSIHDLIDIVNNELVNIVDWLNANKMSLNIEKTHYIIFCNRGKIIEEVGDVLINGCMISKVYTTKCLGMIIDSKLTWKYHIDCICKKNNSKNIGIILKAITIFSQETPNMLYYCFICPYLNYCVHILGSTYISYLTKLLVLQKHIVCIISDVPRLTHSEPLFVELGILTRDRLFRYNIGLLMYKYHHSMLPPVLDMFVKNCQIHCYNTRQSDLHVPQCRTELGKISFKYQAVMVWNHIYRSVDVNIDIGTFKCHLKSHLLSIIS